MERISSLKKRRPQFSITQSHHFPLFTLSTILLLLQIFAGYLFWQEGERSKDLINTAPWNPLEPTEHAFISFSPEKNELQDPLLPVSAETHQLLRKVFQYQSVPNEKEYQLMPVPEASVTKFFFNKKTSGVSILPSDSFYPDFYTNRQYHIKKDFLSDPRYYHKSHYRDLNFNNKKNSNSLCHFLYPNRIFVGKDPHTPSQGDLMIAYESFRLMPLSIYGKIDDNLEIYPISILAGSNIDLKTHLLEKTASIILHSCTVFAFFCSALCLFIMREMCAPEYYRSFFQNMKHTKIFEALGLILIAALPQNPFSAILLAIGSLSYCAMKKWFSLSKTLQIHDRIYFYG